MTDLDRFMVALTCRRYLAEIRALLKSNHKHKMAAIWKPYVRDRTEKNADEAFLISMDEIASEIGGRGYVSIWNFFLEELKSFHFLDYNRLVLCNALSNAQLRIVNFLGVSRARFGHIVLKFRGLKVEVSDGTFAELLGESGELRFIREMRDRISSYMIIRYDCVCYGACERGHWNVLEKYFLTAIGAGTQVDLIAKRILRSLLEKGHFDCARKLLKKGWVTIDPKTATAKYFAINQLRLPPNDSVTYHRYPRHHMELIRFVEELGVKPRAFDYLYYALQDYDIETIRYLNDKYDAISSCDLDRLRSHLQLLNPKVILEFATILKEKNSVAFYQWAPLLYSIPVVDTLIWCVQRGMREDATFDSLIEILEFLESNSVAYPCESHPLAPTTILGRYKKRIYFKSSSQFEKLMVFLMRHSAALGMKLIKKIVIRAIDPSQVGAFIVKLSPFIPQRMYQSILVALCSRENGREEILQAIKPFVIASQRLLKALGRRIDVPPDVASWLRMNFTGH